jgi:transcriptional regulator with XRE-family HTH domain
VSRPGEAGDERHVTNDRHHDAMAIRRKPADIGVERGRAVLASLVRDETLARRDRGLSLADVGSSIGLSAAMGSRIERGLVPDVGIVRMASMLSVVGLELSARAYPGGSPMRDAGHAALLARFRARLHPSLGWGVEVPLPRPGDRRAWDALVRGLDWRVGIEAETHPTDGQALARRFELKVRDGGVDGVILLVPPTRHVKLFLAAASDLLRPIFPVPGQRARTPRRRRRPRRQRDRRPVSASIKGSRLHRVHASRPVGPSGPASRSKRCALGKGQPIDAFSGAGRRANVHAAQPRTADRPAERRWMHAVQEPDHPLRRMQWETWSRTRAGKPARNAPKPGTDQRGTLPRRSRVGATIG